MQIELMKTVTRKNKMFIIIIIKEQYDLRRYPDSQINIVKIDGKDALVYREFLSKTRQGGYLTGAKIQQGCLIVFVQG